VSGCYRPARLDASRNPYVAPATDTPGQDSPTGPVLRCGPRVLAWSLVLGAAYGLVAGAATNIQFTYGLSRFGGTEYIPRVIGLSAVRGWGPWGAALAPSLTAVVVLHRAGKRSTGALAVDPQLALFAVAAVLLLYPIVVLVGCSAALAVWCAGDDGTARWFATTLIDSVLPVDVVHGVLVSVIDVLVIAAGLRLAGASLLSRRWWLLPKVLVVWAVLQGLSFATGYLGRWLV
jgi:ABC-type transporter Mla maintaining outer membrane lipid asymmetry permease subunit MlaE